MSHISLQTTLEMRILVFCKSLAIILVYCRSLISKLALVDTIFLKISKKGVR